MGAEIVNLRQARKRARRRDDEKVADQNRLTHGLTKLEREKIRREAETRDRMLDQSRRETSPSRTADAE